MIGNANVRISEDKTKGKQSFSFLLSGGSTFDCMTNVRICGRNAKEKPKLFLLFTGDGFAGLLTKSALNRAFIHSAFRYLPFRLLASPSPCFVFCIRRLQTDRRRLQTTIHNLQFCVRKLRIKNRAWQTAKAKGLHTKSGKGKTEKPCHPDSNLHFFLLYICCISEFFLTFAP